MNGPSRHLCRHTPHVLLTPTQCLSLLQSYTQTRSIKPGKQLHALIITSGFLPQPLISSKLASLYALCSDTVNAQLLFDRIPKRTPFLYNTLIRGYVQSRQYLEGLSMFGHMVSAGLWADNFTYPFALKASGDLSMLEMGRRIHCRVLVSGFGLDQYVQNSLIAMYMNCRDKEAGEAVFDRMSNRSVVSWNSMIAGCFQNAYAEEALMVFDSMMDAKVEIDEATVVSVLPGCAQLRDLQRGRLVHRLVNENGLFGDVSVRNSLIDMYAKCGRLEDAKRVFDDGVWKRDVVSWTTMIGGCVLNDSAVEAITLGHQMQFSGIRPNSVTLVSLLSACSILPSLKHGKCLHGLCIRFKLEKDIIVETALIDMYANGDDIASCSKVFTKSSRRTGSWNAIISAYARKGLASLAIQHFWRMLVEDIRPDLATIVSVLPAYADSPDLNETMNIHCYLIRMGFLRSIEATTCLIDVYVKTGCLDAARELFERLPTKDFVSWSAIISGYGKHGHAETAIRLFNQMLESGVEPNEVTFTSMLYSCSHAGLVDEGLELFYRMLNSLHIRPHVDHYACIIDLLGRAGRLDEAYKLIMTMPFQPNHAVWGALLGACVLHENVELGELSAKHLFEIEPENTGNYVLLGNIYAAVGRWEDAEAVRSMVKDRGLRKAPGCSSVEVMNG